MATKQKTKQKTFLDLVGEEPTPLDLFALKIAAKACDKVRDRLETAQGQQIDLLVSLKGYVDVGGEQSCVTREKPKADVLLALVFDALGPQTRAKVMRDVSLACALFATGAGEAPEPSAEARKLGEDLAEACGREVRTVRRGNVAGSVQALIVSRGE